jgi:predicted metal-dependent hydrolase
LEAAKRLVRAPVAAADWEGDLAYRYGASLYVQSFFWEAHEVWEAVWKACPPNGVERRLLRGLIGLANAALKLRMGRPKAALRLLREADETFGEVGAGPVMGVAVARLQAAIRELAVTLEAVGDGADVDGDRHRNACGDHTGMSAAAIPAVARILRPLDAVALDLEGRTAL